MKFRVSTISQFCARRNGEIMPEKAGEIKIKFDENLFRGEYLFRGNPKILFYAQQGGFVNTTISLSRVSGPQFRHLALSSEI